MLTSLTAAASLSASAATFTVTNTNDAGAGSLRQAILDSNKSPEDDVVGFSELFETPQTIVLKGILVIENPNKGSLTINGPSQNQLTLSGDQKVGILSVAKKSTATVNNLVLSFAGSIAVACQEQSNLTLNNVTLTRNYVNGTDATAIVNFFGTVTLINSTSTLNGSLYAQSSIYNSGTMTLINSTVSNNYVEIGFGGIYNTGRLSLLNSTVAFNRGGIWSTGPVNMRNSILAKNIAIGTDKDFLSIGQFKGDGKINSQGYNLIGNAKNTVIVGDTATNLLNVDPLLDPVARNNGGVTPTHALLPNSPAIDAALTANGVFTDQRGMPRPVDVASKQNAAGSDTSDIGAVERQQAEVNN